MIRFPANVTNEELTIDWCKIGSNSGCFSNKRDLEIAKYFKSMKD